MHLKKKGLAIDQKLLIHD